MRETVSEAPDWTADVNEVRHIAIIMDGNQRWARAQGLHGVEGHSAGARALKRTVRAAVDQRIKVLTVFAFSSENWRRPEAEVQALMTLFMQALTEELDELFDAGVQLRFIGDTSAFNPSLRQAMAEACERTQQNDRLVFNVAVNYGGRWDIVNACQTIVQNAVASAEKNSDYDIKTICAAVNEQSLSAAMSMADLPPVDLCIRTSGEYRLSNFLLWQIAYAELAFIDTYWPDFNSTTLAQLIQDFQQRQRRFGRTAEQISHLNQAQSNTEFVSEVHWSTTKTVMD